MELAHGSYEIGSAFAISDKGLDIRESLLPR